MTERRSWWRAFLDGFTAIGEGLATISSFGLYQRPLPRRRYAQKYTKTVEQALAEDMEKVSKDFEKAVQKTATYRDPAEKPEPSIDQIWAEMWCMQRHQNDLQCLKEPVWHPAITWFKDSPGVRAAIPAAAEAELRRRGIRLWTSEEVQAHLASKDKAS